LHAQHIRASINKLAERHLAQALAVTAKIAAASDGAAGSTGGSS
jgi:hypothetical protein